MIGYDLVTAGDVTWRKTHGSLIPHSFPHELGAITPAGAKGVLRREGGRLIRWESDFDVPGDSEWWHVVKDGEYDLASLKPKVRNAVRQGIKQFLVRPCTRDDILERSYPVYVSAYERYETFESMFDERAFREAIMSMPEGIEFWVVEERDGGRLEAFAENVVGRDACFFSTMWFTQRALKGSGSYALIQCMNEHYLGERGMRYVSDGARNISHQTNVHQFLQDKFGFRKAYCRLHVEYAPWVAAAVGVLYPFREQMRRMKLSPRIDVLLEQERIRRACKVDGE